MPNPNVEPHVLKEVSPGVYWTLLDFPATDMLLPALLDSSFPYVMCWHHQVGHHRWESFQLPVGEPETPEPVLARVIDVDFVVETRRFEQLLPAWGPRVRAVQLARVPPDHLDLRVLQGNALWNLLGEVGWHVWADIPGNDYAQIASPDRSVVDRAIRIVQNAS